MDEVNLSLDLSGSRAVVRVTGYLSQQAGKNLAVLLNDLGRMEIRVVDLDISRCTPVCMGGLETVLDVKFVLARAGVKVRFSHSPPTVAKVFRLMGLGSDGELRSAAERH